MKNTIYIDSYNNIYRGIRRKCLIPLFFGGKTMLTETLSKSAKYINIVSVLKSLLEDDTITKEEYFRA